jgi:hypothetical protein
MSAPVVQIEHLPDLKYTRMVIIVVLVLIRVALAVVARPHPAVGLLAASAFFFSIDHAAPYGPVGMALFLLAAAQLEFLRQRQAAAVPMLAAAP